MHVNVNYSEYDDFNHHVHPRTSGKTCHVKTYCAHVEGQNVSIFHQWTAAVEEHVAQFLGHQGHVSILSVYGVPHSLKSRRTPFLAFAVVGIVIIKHFHYQRAFGGQTVENGALIGVSVEFATSFAF